MLLSTMFQLYPGSNDIDEIFLTMVLNTTTL